MKIISVLLLAFPGFLFLGFLFLGFLFLGNWAEIAAIYLSLLLTVGALLLPRYRDNLLRVIFALLLALSVSLLLHLALDHFHYAYVWLYSAPDLKLYLKLANFWGGEEGTILFLALLLSGFALRTVRYPGWAGPGVILLMLPFMFGLIIWHPFQMTSMDQLAQAPYQGMNAHLTKFWMAIHPPLIFITYLLLLLPAGAAVESLVRGTGSWKELSLRYGRPAWVILSLGLASGMWWAYEDYFYGQFWHWDPVQTASFVVWCWLTAYLHGIRVFNPAGDYARLLPFLGLLTGASAMGAMLVTRNGALMSSHRYLGETSVKLLAFITFMVLLAAVIALLLSFRRRVNKKGGLSEGRLMIQSAIWGFFIIGLVGCYFLGEAYLRAFLQIPKDKPPLFFALIANVSPVDFVTLLKEQHQRWSVDNFGINAILVPVVYLVALVGGYRFLPVKTMPQRIIIIAIIAILSWLCAEYIRPLEHFYQGSGVTSGITRRNFYQLDMLLVAVGYFSLASFVYALPIGVKRGREKAYFTYIAPVGLIHMGVMIGLFSALTASILDSTEVKKITLPDIYGKAVTLSNGYSLMISHPVGRMMSKGIYSPTGQPGFQAVTAMTLKLGSDRDGERQQGQLLYQDGRKPVAGDGGPIRQYCEVMDYRFARMSRDKSHRIDPFIYRGLAYDLQIWLPAINYLDYDMKGQFIADVRSPSNAEYNIVIRKFPLISGLWLGLGLSLLAGFYYAFFARR